jgi:hypothetical protein
MDTPWLNGEGVDVCPCTAWPVTIGTMSPPEAFLIAIWKVPSKALMLPLTMKPFATDTIVNGLGARTMTSAGVAEFRFVWQTFCVWVLGFGFFVAFAVVVVTVVVVVVPQAAAMRTNAGNASSSRYFTDLPLSVPSRSDLA